MRLVECVPNFSEGRDPEKIRRIVAAVAETPDVAVLHVDSGFDANRTVVTFAGTPEGAAEAAFRLVRAAAAEIDMRVQIGAHPRLGATDVVPFVPLGETSMENCVAAAREVGKRVGTELGIPVYLYEAAASSPSRRNLADVRRGEYEGLKARIETSSWVPDFGPAEFNERSGATIVGARKFLVAFNVNLDTADYEVAQAIAARVRTSGSVREGRRLPGRLPACKAIGWYMPEFGCAQVSMNLTDLDQTGLFEAFTACREEALSYGVKTTGSELVGLIPLRALLAAGKAAGASGDERMILHEAIAALGLEQFNRFELEARVLERVLAREIDRFTSR